MVRVAVPPGPTDVEEGETETAVVPVVSTITSAVPLWFVSVSVPVIVQKPGVFVGA
jgi:hypothetical protein